MVRCMTKNTVEGGSQISARGVKSNGAARSAKPRSHGPWSPIVSFREALAAGAGVVAAARNQLEREAVLQANENFGDH